MCIVGKSCSICLRIRLPILRLAAVGDERPRRFRLDASLLPVRVPHGKRRAHAASCLIASESTPEELRDRLGKHFVSTAEGVCVDRSRRPKLVGKPLEPNSITKAHRGPFFMLKNELRNEFCTRNGAIHCKIIINRTPLSGIFRRLT